LRNTVPIETATAKPENNSSKHQNQKTIPANTKTRTSVLLSNSWSPKLTTANKINLHLPEASISIQLTTKQFN